MQEPLVTLDAFLQEHRRCGDLTSGVEDAKTLVWMERSGCGARISVPQGPVHDRHTTSAAGTP